MHLEGCVSVRLVSVLRQLTSELVFGAGPGNQSARDLTQPATHVPSIWRQVGGNHIDRHMSVNGISGGVKAQFPPFFYLLERLIESHVRHLKLEGA